MGAGVRDKAANIRARMLTNVSPSLPWPALSIKGPPIRPHLPLAEMRTLLGACPSHSQSLGLYCWPLGDLEHPNYGKVYNLAKPYIQAPQSLLIISTVDSNGLFPFTLATAP